jgi:meso-butanediol dehydrogenase / (S,S)-butanediol dehydrogenase / diacetyl reductase
MRRFDGKVALVTGGSNGIGAAVVARLIIEGAKVMIADITPPQELQEGVKFQVTDAATAGQVDAVVKYTHELWGRIDILVNSAGLGALAETPDMSEELWDQLFDVNIKAIFLFCKYAIPVMRQHGGVIINIASISGLGGDYGMGLYNATKGAVINYTRSLALDCARDRIRVNALCPGIIRTSMSDRTVARPEDRAAWMAPIPLGRIGEPEEMASIVAFLASDEASYMTGSIVTADGGVTAHTGQPNVPLRHKLREQRGEA